MEINKNMTRAEQIGHVYEYTSKNAIYIGSRVKNESDFVESVIEKTYMEADERTTHLWDDYSFEYWIDYFHKKCMESIYDSLEPERFSFDFCEISEDVIDFEANLKSDKKDFIYDENDPDINYTNNKYIYDEFEKRYQREIKEQETKSNLNAIDFNQMNDYEISEHRSIHR